MIEGPGRAQADAGPLQPTLPFHPVWESRQGQRGTGWREGQGRGCDPDVASAGETHHLARGGAVALPALLPAVDPARLRQ